MTDHKLDIDPDEFEYPARHFRRYVDELPTGNPDSNAVLSVIQTAASAGQALIKENRILRREQQGFKMMMAALIEQEGRVEIPLRAIVRIPFGYTIERSESEDRECLIFTRGSIDG